MLALGTTLGAVSVGLAADRENGLLKKIFNRRTQTNVKTTAPTQEPPVTDPAGTDPANKGAKRLPVGKLTSLKEDSAINTLSSEEKSLGFELIFNGKDYNGWENKGNWVVEEGAIARKDKGGGITFNAKKVPDNFELRFEWKVGKGSNSGVYYRHRGWG